MKLFLPSPVPLRWVNLAAKRSKEHLRPPKLCPLCRSVSPPVPGLSTRKDRNVSGVPGCGTHYTYVRARILFISEAGEKVNFRLPSIRIVISQNGYMDTNESLRRLRRIHARHMPGTPDTSGTRAKRRRPGGDRHGRRRQGALSAQRWVLPEAVLVAVTRRAGDAYK